MVLLIFKNYNHMLKPPFSFLSFSFSLVRDYSLNSKSYEVFVLALPCCYSPLKELSLSSGTNTNSPLKALNDVITVFTNEDWKCTRISYVVFHEFHEWCIVWQIDKYDERDNRCRGPSYFVAPSSVAPNEAPSPPNEVPSPRSMVPLLNLSQQLGATNPYFRATEFLGRRRNLGLQCKEAMSPTTDERLFSAILIYSNFKFY